VPRQRRGMPKFKSKHRALPSLNYTLRGLVREGRVVRLAGGLWCGRCGRGSCPPHRRVCGSTATRWADGVLVRRGATGYRTVGRDATFDRIDWGVAAVATTTSADHDLPHRQYGRRAAARLARISG